MDFFESLFDFNGDGKVDWLDTADELAVMQLIKEAEKEEQRHSSSAYDFNDDVYKKLKDNPIDRKTVVRK